MIRQFPVGFFPGVAPCHNGAIASVGVSRRALPPFSPGGQNGRLVSMSGPYGPWRRWRDSNSRRLFASLVFKTGAFDHSTTSAYGAALRTAYEPDVQTANFLYGPSGETRTPDPMLPKHVRYQLRYTRIFFARAAIMPPEFFRYTSPIQAQAARVFCRLILWIRILSGSPGILSLRQRALFAG